MNFMQYSHQAREAKRDSKCNQKRTATQKAGHKNNPSSGNTGDIPDKERERIIGPIFLPLTDHVKEEDISHVPAPITYIADERFK